MFDYVRRAMPFGDAQSLQPDQLFAVVAYLLYLNDLVDDKFVLSKQNFAAVRLPNEAGFTDDPRPDTPGAAKGGPCMARCKEDARITGRARILDVTPTEEKNPSARVD